MSGRAWSSADDGILKHELVVGGDWLARTAAMVQRSVVAVRLRGYLLRERGEIDAALWMQRRLVGHGGRGGREWTGAEVVELRRLIARRVPTTRIAVAVGRTGAAVQGRIALLGGKTTRAVTRGGWTARDNENLREMRGEGMTYAAIAAEFGRTEKAVSTHAQYIGAALRVRWSPAEDLRLRGMRGAGMTDRQIGVALGRSHRSVEGRRELLRERR